MRAKFYSNPLEVYTYRVESHIMHTSDPNYESINLRMKKWFYKKISLIKHWNHLPFFLFFEQIETIGLNTSFQSRPKGWTNFWNVSLSNFLYFSLVVIFRLSTFWWQIEQALVSISHICLGPTERHRRQCIKLLCEKSKNILWMWSLTSWPHWSVSIRGMDSFLLYCFHFAFKLNFANDQF